MLEAPLNTRKPSQERWFNRAYTCLYTIGILTLFYRHCCNLINSPSFITIFLLVADHVLALIWATWQTYFLNPFHRQVFPENLPKLVKESEYPRLDVVVCTADPFKEPPVKVVNTVLSVMAYEYPMEKLSVYVSDDGGSQLTLFAFIEAADQFAKHWLPFCRMYDLMDRSPDTYFGNDPFMFPEAYEIKAMYETMKTKIEKVVLSGTVNPNLISNERWIKAFSRWTPTFTPQNHPAVVEILLESNEDKDNTGQSLPNLIYVSREKNKNVHYNFKGGALNTMIRVSAAITDAPIFLVLDCDMYSNNPKTPLYALCHFLDPQVDPNLAFVQFPQRFNDINKFDTYGSEHLLPLRAIPRGMDGFGGTMFIGTGGFFNRQALIKTTSDGASYIKNVKSHRFEKKSIKSDDILIEAHRVAGCQYEENTRWGSAIGFRYGSLIEDIYTSFRLHCEGWTSVFCDPERAAFLGNYPMSLSDILIQSKRWFVGSLEMIFAQHNPITYGFRYMNPIHALSYANHSVRPFWAIPIVTYALLPQLALLNSIAIFPKVSDPWFPLYAFLVLGAYTKSLVEFKFAGGVFSKWWNTQRFWLIWGCSSYPFSMIDWVLKSVGLSTIEFTVTSKVMDDEVIKRYEAGLFEFGVESPMFLTISIAAVVNLFAFLMGSIYILKNGAFDKLFAQLFIVGYGVVNCWPIYDSMVFRSDKGKMPAVITCKAIGVSYLLFLLFVIFHRHLSIIKMFLLQWDTSASL